MPRIPLTKEQQIAYKLLDFKRWVREQMARYDMTQEDVGDAIGVSQGQVSQMIDIKGKNKKNGNKDPDPFTLRQVLILFDLFEAEEDVRKKLTAL